MLLTFARSAFALPAIDGVVLAAGSATCRANAQATAKADKRGTVACVARGATQAQALRTRAGVGSALARGVAQGASKLSAAGFGAATGRAQPNATPQCDLKALGGVLALAAPGAWASRRVRTTGHCYASAGAFALAQNWALVRALPAAARAVVWGTYHPVGRGLAPAGVVITGDALRSVQADGAAPAGALAYTSLPAVNLAAGAGVASAWANPIAGIRRHAAGVGYQDGFGDVVARAQVAGGTVLVHPTLLVVAKAVSAAWAEVARAVRGMARAQALVVSGDANLLLPTTQVGGVTISAALTGAAMVTCYARGSGQCSIRALPGAAILRTAAAGGVLLAVSTEAAAAEITRPSAGAAAVPATVAATALRTANCTGRAALGVALTDAGVQINPLSPSTYVIEVEVPDTLIEALVPETLVTVDAIDTLVEAA